MRKLSFVVLVGLLAAIRLASSTGSSQAAEQKPLWLAVSRVEFAEAIEPLAEKRRSDGFQVLVSAKTVEEATAESPRRPDFLLLVGDDEPGQEQAPWYLPAKRVELYRWRSPAEELCLRCRLGRSRWRRGSRYSGRPDPSPQPCPGELMVRKILAFESQPPKAADLQAGRLARLAGIQRGDQCDGLRARRSDGPGQGPAVAAAWFVSGNRNDSFCGWPPEQPARFTRQIKQGGFLAY